MVQVRDIRSFLAKAARVALVFMLVFWSSLRLEYFVAYGADGDSVKADDGAGHEDGTLGGFAIYQSSTESAAWHYVAASTVTTPEITTVEIDAKDAGHQFVAVPIWKGDQSTGDGAEAVPEPEKTLEEVTSAQFAKWELESDGDPCVKADTPADGKNIFVLQPVRNGSAVVKCGVDDTRPADKGVSVTFKVAVSGYDSDDPETPDASEELLLENPAILDSEGKAIAEDGLVLDEKFASEPYQLKAVVTVESASGKTATYHAPEDGRLSEFTGDGAFKAGQLNDLSWSVEAVDGTEGQDPAKIDENGVLSVGSEGRYKVTCIASTQTQQTPYAVMVVVGDPDNTEDPQGRSRPQNTLLVSSNVGIPALSAKGASTSDDANAADADSESASDSASDEQGVMLNQEYTVDMLNGYEADGSWDFSTDTYRMRTSDASVSITGKGFALKQLLEDAFEKANADESAAQIEKVQFINYAGSTAAEIPWTTAQKADIMVAMQSYVHPDGAAVGDEAGQEGAEGQPELLDNTRFRILFDSAVSSIDADSLRWIKEIKLVGETKSSAQFKTSITYTPVPLGVYAEFVAVPGMGISGSWDCSWEVLPEDGLQWLAVLSDGSAGKPLAEEDPDNLSRTQALRVKTTEESVGNQYRVTITTNKGEEDRSDPVELVASSDPCVQLSYNPPQAGDTAIFQSNIYGYSGDVSRLEYVWEWSNDGGGSWNVVAGESAPTLKIPTEPVSPDDSDSSGDGSDESPDEGSAADLIYIRVRAITPADFVMVSNVVPLTVHVGDEDSGTSGDESGRADGENRPAGGETSPSVPGSGSTSPTPPSAPTQSRVTELDGITVESSMPTAALNPDGTTTRPSQSTPLDSSRVYINDAVTEQIAQQQEAAEAYAASNVPGARWTQLDTLNPTGDDVRRVLEDNPIAPFVIPVSLGALAAGGIEKLLFFRRQMA